METVKQMAEMIGIDEGNMKMFLDLYAIEVKAGATLEQAVQRVQTLFERMAHESQKPEGQQADWYIAWKKAIAIEVWHTIRRQEELKQVFA